MSLLCMYVTEGGEKGGGGGVVVVVIVVSPLPLS